MVTSKEIRVKPIGYVHRASEDEDVKDRSLISRIVIQKDFSEALEGIEDFSHLFVIFYMHEVPKEQKINWKTHPRGRMDLPLVGVFATRTAFRPNPIGLTLVELLKREGYVLVVRGFDAFDGTPVLDLKPANGRDMVARPRIPDWLRLLEGEKRVHSGTKH